MLFFFSHLFVVIIQFIVDNNIGSGGAEIIGEWMKQNTVITCLWLYGMCAVIQFFSRLLFSACFSDLYICLLGFSLLFLINSIIVGNKIGADGAKFISEGMKENKVITHLYLGGILCLYCRFLSSVAFMYFSLICLSMTFFVSIDSIIAGNNIGVDGAKFISERMKENKVITHLGLGGMFVFIFIFDKCCFHLFLTCLSFHALFFVCN